MFILDFFRIIYDSLRYARAIRELNGLTDRELADLGINRADIPRVVFDSTVK